MTGVVRETARAKLNLFLDVTGRRADGYHDLCTVFHEIDLADDLTIRASDSSADSLDLSGDAGDDVPRDGRNLVLRAARALLDGGAAVAISLRKRIPSADRLEDLGAALGSDVPFLVRGGSALGRGRGERLVPVPARPVRFLLLVPDFPLATAAVYRALPRDLAPPEDVGPTLAALAAGDAAALGAACRNALFPAACAVDPRAAEVRDAAAALLGPRVHLTGSGSVFFVPLAPGETPPEDLAARVPHLRRTILTASAGTRDA
jgi:4-diphosphocytidyl-2-C-methyl-D-erythritol kinase